MLFEGFSLQLNEAVVVGNGEGQDSTPTINNACSLDARLVAQTTNFALICTEGQGQVTKWYLDLAIGDSGKEVDVFAKSPHSHRRSRSRTPLVNTGTVFVDSQEDVVDQ